MYRPLPIYLQVLPSDIHGYGLFTDAYVEKGWVIGITHVKHPLFPQGWLRTPLGGFYNHSDKPNCVLIDDKLADGTVVKKLKTLQTIPPKTEITVTYSLYKLHENNINPPANEWLGL